MGKSWRRAGVDGGEGKGLKEVVGKKAKRRRGRMGVDGGEGGKQGCEHKQGPGDGEEEGRGQGKGWRLGWCLVGRAGGGGGNGIGGKRGRGGTGWRRSSSEEAGAAEK